MTFRKRLSSFSFAATLILLATQFAFAQAPAVRLPRPSQKSTVMQTIGVTDVTITYSRPGVKGRRILGDPSRLKPAQKAKPHSTIKMCAQKMRDCAVGTRLAHRRQRSNSVCSH